MTATVDTSPYARPRQYWKWDVAIGWARTYSRLSGKRFTVRRFGSTNNGKPVWEIAPSDPPR